jgi:hypothetical protein
MLDPITAIATATAAFNGVKKLVAAGRDLEDCMGQMAQWYTALSDLSEAEKIAKNPPLFKKLTSRKSVEQEALEIFAHRRKAQAQEKELREIILYAYGKDAWIELIGLRRRIRLEREKAIYAQKRKREDTFWTVITIIVLTFLCYGFYATLSFVIHELKPPSTEQTTDKPD